MEDEKSSRVPKNTGFYEHWINCG